MVVDRSGPFGLIGTGRMGSAMARRALSLGVNLVVHDAVRARAEMLAEFGAKVAPDLHGLVGHVDTVLVSVPSDAATSEVCLGHQGVLSAMQPGDVLVDLGTSSLDLTRRIARQAEAQGIAFLDLPVSGAPTGALAGSLTLFAGATAEQTLRLRPFTGAVGRRLVHLDRVGSGQIAKQVNNLANSITLAGALEAVAAGCHGGSGADVAVDALLSGRGRSWMLANRRLRIVERSFGPPQHDLVGRRKDLRAALALGRHYGMPLTLGQAVLDLVSDAIASGNGHLDAAALMLEFELRTAAGQAPTEATRGPRFLDALGVAAQVVNVAAGLEAMSLAAATGPAADRIGDACRGASASSPALEQVLDATIMPSPVEASRWLDEVEAALETVRASGVGLELASAAARWLRHLVSGTVNWPLHWSAIRPPTARVDDWLTG